jgi:RNA polymerase sigma factor (sigma-70 family)
MPHTPTLSGAARLRSTPPELHAGALSPHVLQHESDERLVALTRAGSERAFGEITRRYQRPLRAYCSRLVGAERAQDAVQQALLQAFLSLRDRTPREIALRPWLYRIAHNCAVDLLRMGSWEYEQLDVEYDGVPQPPALFEQKEELRGLVAGMRRLPEAQRKALALRELEGCSYEEISARLGHTGSGVRQLIFRARSALRKGASAALIPFGLIRERLAAMAPAAETHHLAGMAAVPAQSGGGFETLGAAALAVVAVVGGMAGGVRGGHAASRGPAPSAPSAPVASAVAAAPRLSASPPLRTRHDRRSGHTGAARGAAPDVLVTTQALEPATPVALPPLPPEPVPAPEPSAPPSEAPAAETETGGGEGTAVAEQQTMPAPERTDTVAPPAAEAPPPAPPAAPLAPAPAGGEPAPAPQSAAAQRRPPAKPRPPVKPKPPATQPAGQKAPSKPPVPKKKAPPPAAVKTTPAPGPSAAR